MLYMLYLKKWAMLGLSICSLAVFHSRAFASDYQYILNQAFSGTAPAATNQAWIDTAFRTLSNGTVQLTVSNLNLTGAENVDQLYLNLNPAFDATKLNFTYVSGSGGFDLPSIIEGTNAFKADGDGKYDVLFNFTSNSNDKHQFTQGEWFTYNITGITGLTAADFQYLSMPAGGVGPFYAAAHVQRIGNNDASGWISPTGITPLTPVPEPSAASLVGLALSVYFGLRLWKRASKAADQTRQLRPLRFRSRPSEDRRRDVR
jgi:hypothetical protein